MRVFVTGSECAAGLLIYNAPPRDEREPNHPMVEQMSDAASWRLSVAPMMAWTDIARYLN